MILAFIGPLYLLYFGFLGGFGAAVAQGGSDDHSIWGNALVGAIGIDRCHDPDPGLAVGGLTFAGPLPTLIGAAPIWTAFRRLTPAATEVAPPRI